VTVARNRVRDRLRRESLRPAKEFESALGNIGDIMARTEHSEPNPVRDDELRMMFTCAHPALDPSSRLALTLRLVSGLTVPEIARALLQSEAAVGQTHHQGQAQDPTRQHTAAGAIGRAAARTHTARTVLHLLGVHRRLLVDRRPIGDPRRALRREHPDSPVSCAL
jgi:predicted RNA polymerase sigma factor